MDVETLRRRWRDGWRPPLVHFWGHRREPDGQPGPGCLSQFWPSPFQIEGQLYLTAEHWMMASKARLFGDDEALLRILTSLEPVQAKAIGRQVRGFQEDVWRAHRHDIVKQGNLAKFGQHEAERAFLCSTAPAVLVEASPHDRIWGIGRAANDPRAADPATWGGLNLLGFVLMEVRDQLAAAL